MSSLGPVGSSGGGGGPGSVTSGGAPSEANAGPRIFVGKLTKGTTEEDVKQYFTRCACQEGQVRHAGCRQIMAQVYPLVRKGVRTCQREEVSPSMAIIAES